MIEGITIMANVTTGFLWTFWAEIVAAALCIGARLYHTKIILKTPKTLFELNTTKVMPPTSLEDAQGQLQVLPK
jgi:hypothetical protein